MTEFTTEVMRLTQTPVRGSGDRTARRPGSIRGARS